MPKITKQLDYGARGRDVVTLQKFLIAQGYSIPAGVTGNFLGETRNALKQYQLSKGIITQTQSNDNSYLRVGPSTLSSINATPASSTKVTPTIYGDIGQSIGTPTPKPKPTPAPYGPIQQPAEETTPDVTPEQDLEDVMDAIVESGQTINPDADFASLSIEEFLAEAEKIVAPEYKQKFDLAKQNLATHYERVGEDLNLAIEGIQRQASETKTASGEEYAGRGTTFSSRRGMYERKLGEESERQQEAKRTLAFRSAEDAGRTTEHLIGSEKYGELSIPLIGGEQAYTPTGGLIGSLETDRQYSKDRIAKQLELEQNQRKALSQSFG